MKKTLFLSVAASTLIMAGGDIAPVQPAVATPAPAAPVASGWDFGGQAVVYYQTADKPTVVSRVLAGVTSADLFDQEASYADFGLQLRATNNNVFAGIGAGVEINGLSTLNLENWLVSDTMQGTGVLGDVDDVTDGGWISQMYLTYGFDNTNIKLGRQELPKALSPFAFSEGWNVFKNTFDAVLVVNKDIQDTTLVGAWVGGNNSNGLSAVNNLTDFNPLNPDNGVYMLTAQNKSVDGLTLTGTYYYAPEMSRTGDDTNIFWGDAKFSIADYALGLQGGYVDHDAAAGDQDTVAFGAKAGANFGMLNASLAYSYVNEDSNGVFNVGGVKTPLYTQMILNQGVIKKDSQYIKATVGADVLDGKLGLAYGMRLAADDATLDKANPYELDLTYKTKVFGNTDLFAGYILTDADDGSDSVNTLRVWTRYNF